MISPLWILNSALAVISIITLAIIMLTQEHIPARTSLKTPAVVQRKKEKSKIIDITRIYQNDLFGTYVAPLPPQPEEVPRIAPLPEPPQYKPIFFPAPTKPDFVTPLPLALKGIIIATSDKDTRAIIGNTQSGKEDLYKIGDVIEDAELIHISYNKIILIRSNGQQETIFLNNKEAKLDPIYAQNESWANVVHKNNDSLYSIDPKAFTERITSLAQFLDMLDMTTVFQNGLSVGCRVGTLLPSSIGSELGLQNNDIIISVNDIPPTTTSSRIAIYDVIKKSTLGDHIVVKLIRANQEQQITFVLETFEQDKTREPLIPGMPLPARTNKKDLMNLLLQAPELETSVQQIKKRDRMAMLRQGGRGSLLQRIS
jgi:type II secretory pathway component PulC